jgi:hypothetical protein
MKKFDLTSEPINVLGKQLSTDYVLFVNSQSDKIDAQAAETTAQLHMDALKDLWPYHGSD